MKKGRLMFARWNLLGLFLLASFFYCIQSQSALAAESAAVKTEEISNEFIRIRANAGLNEMGRFAVDTTGGDPSRSIDDNKVLIYGSREPWTSYTTVHVDGQPFIFGGPTSRRAGKNIKTGNLTQSVQKTGNTLSCAVRIGDIEVTQTLGFARNPTTRVNDAARIAYQVVNRGNGSHAVGLRIVLDAMLGENDGAPLRVGERAIATATRIAAQSLPDYWQAFDSLSQPAVIAQGTLRSANLTPPDRLEMVDWGTLADAPWEFPFPEGADFTRQGEQEQDTAVALYWDPRPLKPGESRTYATLYGIGGVSLSPAQLSLGLSAPAEVDYQYGDTKPVTVIAYLENSGGFESRQTACAIQLPKGLRLEQGHSKVQIGLLKSGETKQLMWRLLPTGEDAGTLKMAVVATSENLESNTVEREIIINSPPQLSVAMTAPKALAVTQNNRHTPNPFEVKATVANLGAQPGNNLVVTLSTPEGLKLLDESTATQVSKKIEPGARQTYTWSVRALGLPTGEQKLALKATAAGAKDVATGCTVMVPELTPEIRVYPAAQSVAAETDGKPTLIPIAVKLAPTRDIFGCQLSISFDPKVLEPLYVSRGEVFVEGGGLLSTWSSGRIGEGTIANIGGDRGSSPLLNVPESTLFTIVFMANGPGNSKVTIKSSHLFGPKQKEIQHRAVEGSVKIHVTEEK